eukprot:scaffold180909_cov53-Cyclotella_meneghiniana.AAC.1
MKATIRAWKRQICIPNHIDAGGGLRPNQDGPWQSDDSALTGGRWAIAMGPAEELQPPFASSSGLDPIQHQFLTFARRSTSPCLFKTKRFHRNIRYAMSDVPMKALGDAT